MFTPLFWIDAIERAIATSAQFLLVLGGADGLGFLTLGWEQLVTLSALGAFTSILKSLAAAKAANTDTASFTVDTKDLK